MVQSMSEKKPNILKELLPVEVKEDLLTAYAHLAFRRGQGYPYILKQLAKTNFPRLIKTIEALEKNSSAQNLFPLYIDAKRTFLETQIWFDLNVRILKTYVSDFQVDKEKEVEAVFATHLPRIEKYTEKVFTQICGQFPKTYGIQLDQVSKELDLILKKQAKDLEKYPVEKREKYGQLIEKSKEWLARIVKLVEEERPKWLRSLLSDTRGLSISDLNRFPYSLLYTARGSLHICLETPEHFLGIGQSKIICRSIDLDKGKFDALVKPRTLFALKKEDKGDEERSAKHEEKRALAFESALRESDFLMRLKGKEGVIQILDRIVFKINEKNHLYLIEKQYADQSLLTHIFASITKGKKEEEFPLKIKIQIARQLLQGLIAIQKEKILHRDIKPANILLDLSDPENVKAAISDFNLACYLHEAVHLLSPAFSPSNCTPEYAVAFLNKDSKATVKASTLKLDVWGLGSTFYYLFFNQELPWMIPTATSLEESIKRIIALTPSWIPKECLNKPFAPLVQKMLRMDPNERVSAQQAFEEFEKLAKRIS